MPRWAKNLLVALVALLLLLLVSDFVYWTRRFPPNCYLEKVDVSGLTKYETLKTLKIINVDDVVLNKIDLSIGDQVFTFKPSNLGIYISPKKTISNAQKLIRGRNYILDLFRRATNRNGTKILPLSLDVNESIANAVLLGIANSFDEPIKEATFSISDSGNYRITKEKIGRKVDIKATIKNIEAELDNNKRTISGEVVALFPRVYAKTLVKYPPKYLLAEYTTYYGSHDSPNRVHNIKLASSRTNNYILVSGEVFSLLNTLGDFTKESGYKEAFVLYNGELEPQFGGGSCQIASTLYNAALLAGLDIVERHNHGIYFTIYPLGRDASIYSGGRDLKIGNNTSHPVYIKTFATDTRLTYKIYGTPHNRKINITRPMIFFEGEKFIAYDITSDEAKAKINEALLSGRSYYTYVKVKTMQAGYLTEKVVWSHYKMTGDKESVHIVRPEPE